MKAVSVFMDVEDPINPLADDAALDFPTLFSDLDIRGSFCLTGEKCRTAKARGRTDLSAAYRKHGLGLHTNTHSFHPTTMEALAETSFEEGCAVAYAAERKGFDAFVTFLTQSPAFWGGAGNTWSPEITDALKRMRIPAYSYALTAVPNDGVHRFNGVVALPQALSISELDWADDARAKAESDRVLRRIGEIGQPWVGIFVGHPTKFRHKEYWDTPYFNGRTPEEPEFVEALPAATYSRSKKNLRMFLERLAETHRIVGADDAVRWRWKFRPPTDTEMEFFRRETPERIRAAAKWGVHKQGLDAENIVEKTLALADTLEVAYLE